MSSFENNTEALHENRDPEADIEIVILQRGQCLEQRVLHLNFENSTLQDLDKFFHDVPVGTIFIGSIKLDTSWNYTALQRFSKQR